MLLASNNSVR